MALSVGAPGAWAPRAALDFLRNAGAALAAGRAKGRWPSAGRSRGVVMVARALILHLKRRRLCDGEFGRPRDPKNRQCIESASETASGCTGLCFIHAREAFAASACCVLFCQSGWRRWLEQRAATGSLPTAGRAAASWWVSDVCSLWIPGRHSDGFIRWRPWRVGAEGRAGFFTQCRGGAGRWPGQGAVAECWPQPRRGDGRAGIEFASETAPALRRRVRPPSRSEKSSVH